MCKLESLKTVTALRFLAYNIQNRVYKLSTLGVMSLSPVVTCSGLAKDEVVWTEDLSEGAGADGVHGAGLQVDEHGTRHIFASGGFIVVNVDPLQLKIRVPMVCTGWVDAVFVRDHLPEFGADLVATLASLHVHDFSHVCWCW